MANTITMPPLSQTTDTVTLVAWLVKEGDRIEKGGALADVETDKVSTQVESFASGTVLKIIGAPGDVITVGSAIAYIGEPGEAIPVEKASAETSAPAKLNAESGLPSASKPAAPKAIRATALVQNLAEKRGVDLRKVTGSGPGGLIVKDDVLKYLAAGGQKTGGGVQVTGTKAPMNRGAVTALSRNQRAIAENLTKSAAEIPQYHVRVTVYVDGAKGLIETWRAVSGSGSGQKLSTYAYYVYAAAGALAGFPAVNGCYRDGNLASYKDVNVGFALSVGRELYVPVIRNADGKSLEEIDKEIREISARIQGGIIKPSDVSDCTFTVSNLGVYPVDDFTAMVTPGQAGILAIGRTGKTLAIEADGSMHLRDAVRLTGGFDHRIVNGAEGASFMGRIKEIMEGEK